MTEDPFKILNIPSQASLVEVKKAFRALILSLHPDITGDESGGERAALVIDAYKRAGKISEERARESRSRFERVYRERFGSPFREPEGLDDHIRIFESLLKSLDGILFSAGDAEFFLNYSRTLIEREGSELESDDKPLFTALYSSLFYICRGRNEIFKGRQSEGDYSADRVRERVISYFMDIMNTTDYLSFRYSLNSPKDELLKELYLVHGKSESPHVREELFALLLLIFVVTEERFSELWWPLKK